MLPKNSNSDQRSDELHSPKTFPVFDLHIHLIDNYTNWLLARLDQGISTHVVTLNAEMSMMAKEDSALSQTIKMADLVIPDGAGVILYMRMRGFKYQRCPGIELAESLIRNIGESTHPQSICFFGGAPHTPEQAALAWQEKFPNLSILTQHGYISAESEIEWKQTLKAQQPGVIFVAIGVPRQEFWIRDNRHLCPNSLWVGVGGSFDIWAGNKLRAPKWLKDNNLEWSYRLYKEPWRWRRMLLLPRFFWRSIVEGKVG